MSLVSRHLQLLTCLAVAGCCTSVHAASPDAATEDLPGSGEEDDPPSRLRPVPKPRPTPRTPHTRRVLIGLEAVAMQVPSLRPSVVTLDQRFLGATTTLGGAGLLARFRPNPWIGVETGIRSGSVRYRSVRDTTLQMSQDLILFEAGVLLYVARGRYAHLAVDTGGGGLYNRVGYVSQQGEGVQTYGSGTIRVGLNLEVLLQRIAFVFSLRSYGVLTPRASRATGPLFGEQPIRYPTPAAALQTYLVGSFGVAYRF